MKTKYLYLLIDLLAFGVPFALSFHPKAKFSAKWKFFLPAILVSGILFLVWDQIFAANGIWGFNPEYLLGIYILDLPLEEVLFFFCIPYACLFTYYVLSVIVEKDHLFPHQELISSFLIIITLIAGLYFRDRVYTSVVLLLTGFFLAFHMLRIRPRYMGRFYFAFGLLLIPFIIINGILTGSFIEGPVVWYNPNEITGLRVGTIPIEDFFYALLLILIPIFLADELETYVLERERARKKSQPRKV